MLRYRTSFLLLGAVFTFASIVTAGAEEKSAGDDFVSKSLAREIIGPRQAQAEVADYCESATPEMPTVKTVADWEDYTRRVRSSVFDQVIFRGRAAAWRDAKLRVEWLDTIPGGPGYRIKKLRYEALPGLWIPALLYEPENLTGKVPVVLDVNGHERVGKSADYKQVICINQAKRGMLALNIEWFDMGQFRDGRYRHDLINHIDLCGTSGIATHYLAMTRGIDVLLSLEHADPTRVAVTGLSGGGWQTIFVSAFDTRVTLTDPVAGYSSFRTRARYLSDLGDSEQTPNDLATVTDYAIMTAMMAPRATLLTFNATDNCCFASGHALPPLLKAATPIFELYGKPEKLRSHINTDPGTHNYLVDNRQAFYRMAGDSFYPGDSHFDAKEIPSDSEVKKDEELLVPLPQDNATLTSLALGLSEHTPKLSDLPREKDKAKAWQESHREKLREIVRAKRYKTQAERKSESEEGGIKAVFWRLKIGEWSVPAVELSKGSPAQSTILLADAGRSALAAEAAARLKAEANVRLLLLDPFYIGESKIAERDYLYALLLAAIGDRPLGLQASQVAAAARWLKQEYGGGSISLVADGPRTSVMALVAGALEEQAISSVSVKGSYGSLRELIEAKTVYNSSPELFCFGLLKDFDVSTLAALVAPRPVSFASQTERLKGAIAGLDDWSQLLGAGQAPKP